MTARAASRRGVDDLLVVALAAGLTVAAAAERAGVSPATVTRRLRDATFRARVTDARAQAVERAGAQLTAAFSAAVETLVALLRSPNHSVAIAAATRILDLGLRLREAHELEQRLCALEAERRPALRSLP
ncbi:MAG: hypothetical protein ABR529_11965, partial [Actinomycetota bacterium]